MIVAAPLTVSPTLDAALTILAAVCCFLALVVVVLGRRFDRRLANRVAELERQVMPRPAPRRRHAAPEPEHAPATVEIPALPRPGEL